MPILSPRVYRRRAPQTRVLCGLFLAALLVIVLGRGVTAQQEALPGTPAPVPAKISMVVAGESREVQTLAPTVGEMLAQEKAYPGKEDRCSVPLSAVPAEGMKIVITRIETRRTVERIAIPFKTRQRYTTSLRSGVRQVAQAGAKGEIVKTFLEVYKDGKRTQRKKVAHQSTKPRMQIVHIGVRGMLSSRGYFSGRRLITMESTGYGPAGNGRWGARTASGLRPGYGVVAVDPRFIPLGTRLYVDGYGYAVAGDTGGAIKGARIDLGFDSNRAAMRHGRRKVKVLILN
uniref:Cell wall-binding protein n=1 Tax=uncultured Armatimonadetes bacterium TaxID=157466 RepID=A0A6J4JX18_9BACT|nr:Cell wall-binding protein [uncultured Armatimonadetes bacterium]